MRQIKASCGIVAAAASEEMLQTILLLLRDLQKAVESTGPPLRITKASSLEEIRRALAPAGAAAPPSILIYSLSRREAPGIDDLLMLSGRNPHLQILLLTGKETEPQIAFRCRKFPVYVFALPLRKQALTEMLRMLVTMWARAEQKEEELQRMHKKLNELGVVTKAKCLLIQMRQMTEEEAHHYLERRAMDESLSKKDVAAEIIRMYS